MGPYRLLNNLILISLLIIIPSINTQDWCPSDCKCRIIAGKIPRNHAKCNSLNDILDHKNLPIHSLDLSNTNLTKINHLDKLRLLQTINLSHNKLSDIGHLGPRLKHINLSHNKLTSAKLGNIYNSKSLEDLDISYNEITYLPLELSQMNLRRFELHGNKLNCTCDTFEVRNWLEKNSVYTTHPVKCTYPIELKDRLWLSIKQSLYCKNDQEKVPHNNNNNNNDDKIELSKKFIQYDDDNDLMLADEPILDGSGEDKKNDDVDELESDFIKVNKDIIDENHEGSGFTHLEMVNEPNETKSNETNSNDSDANDQDDDDADGSGDDLFTLNVDNNDMGNNATEETNDVTFSETESNDSDETTPIPIPIDEDSTTENNTSIEGIGIFGVKNDQSQNNATSEEQEEEEEEEEDEEEEEVVSESPFIPMMISENENSNNSENNTDNVDVISSIDGTDAEKDDMVLEAGINKAETDEGNGAYILVGTIVIILICLLMYIGMKKLIKRKHNQRDSERGAAELVDMDKKNLGKPLQKNGNEQKPLIKNENEKPVTNGTKKPYTDNDVKTQEPLLNGHHKEPNENESNNNSTKPQTNDGEIKIPIPEPRQSLQQQQQNSPTRVHSPRYGNYPPKSPRSSDTIDRGGSSPSSPKAGRYSPVYSPETGKVKIKLAEVPKPKTPMLVTRSRSNAGEIVTTPTSSDVANSEIKSNENN